MFLIKQKEELYALRPEATASIARAYIENSLDKTIGFTKLYYLGPMFRYERPQKGRLRQFHHLGCEVIGSYSPNADIEVISLASRLLTVIGVQDFVINLNSLGCRADREHLTALTRDMLSKKNDALCRRLPSAIKK